jgi:N-methylhydantoinase A
MREHIKTVLYIRGFSPSDYHLLSYGGAGPLFMAGYTEGLPFKGIATLPFAAAFSSFGCAAMDFAHRYQKSTCITLPYGADDKTKMEAGEVLNRGWDELEQLAIREIEEEGWQKQDVSLQHVAYVRYGGQLEDLEVFSPVPRINTPQDMDQLMGAFEKLYTQIYVAAARYPEAGYQVLEQGVLVIAPKPKPVLRRYPMDGREVVKDACKGERAVYMKGKWRPARVYEMDRLNAGNEVKGLAIIEGPATTLLVPAGKKIRVDEFKMFWLE